MRKLLPYLAQGVLVGAAVGFFALLMFRQDVLPDRPIVEFTESTQSLPTQSGEGTGPVSYAEAVEGSIPAVVNIYTTKVVTRRTNPLFDDPFFRRFFGDALPPVPRQRLENSLGSGVIVSESGYLLTNNHVIQGADQIEIALADGRTAEAAVVGTDPESDLAVLKIALTDLPAMVLGDSEHLRVGDVVLAIGNPFGVGQTVTMGIVSATGRSELGISTYENFIQTDAAINPGNSGGALINAFGQLIGINTAIYSRTGGSQGIGFAIPISLAKGVMKQIIEQGRAVRGWLGIETQNITPELAESFGMRSTRGIIVAGVLRDGPADRAGIEAGDIIREIDGTAVADARSVMNRVAQMPPGSTLTVTVVRQGEKLKIPVEVGERPAPPPPRAGGSR